MPPIQFTSADDCVAQVKRMRAYYDSGITQSYNHRYQALAKLKTHLKSNETRILDALQKDLGKAHYEGFVTELGLVYDEISLQMRMLRCWMRPKWRPTPIDLFPATSKIYPSPFGVAVVMAPWNYPVQLSLVPLVDAIAAGNCVGLKLSKEVPTVYTVVDDILSNIFDPDFVCPFTPSSDMDHWLMEPQFDFVFFTGSARVGSIIMQNAGKHLSPVVLELGGQSPCFVDKTANILRAAQRIAWGKGVNTGQTCVAPNHLFVHEDVVGELVTQLHRFFHVYYGENILECPWWPHIISEHHYDRIMGLINDHNPNATIAFGGRGNRDALKIEPTVMLGVTLDDPVMDEEIFGPVLPIITYKTIDEALAIACGPHFGTPLACYLFSEDRAIQQQVIHEMAFGGGCINDVLVHASNNHIGFGGKGTSGLGEYHGKTGFDTFTHYKSVVSTPTWMGIGVRTPPFTEQQMDLAHLFMR